MTWLAGIWVSGIVKMYSLAEAAAAAADKSGAHMWKWYCPELLESVDSCG